MRPFSKRERWFIVLLPAAVIPLVWCGYVRGVYTMRRDAAALALSGAQSVAEANDPAVLERERNRLSVEGAQLARRNAALLARWSLPSERAAVVRRASLQLAGLDACVVTSGPATDDPDVQNRASGAPTAAPPLPARLQKFARGMADRGGAPPELWRFDLRGSFSGLSAALERLGAADGFALPVLLSLKRVTDSDELALRLWVWI